jgi:hypothetical protein
MRRRNLSCLFATVFATALAACGGGSAPSASGDAAGVVADTTASAPSPAPDTTAGTPAATPAATTASPASEPVLGPAPAPASGSSAQKATLFFSGHSLMDNPMPDDTSSIASSLGRQALWNQQNYIGSPIRARTRGMSMDDPSFSGYKLGKNREGSNMNVVSELRSPQTVSGRYDALVLTERHDLALSLQYEDTVRYARHFHERLIEGNPSAGSYLYHSWLGVRDKSNPASWIAYERSAAPVWQCVASRINTSLAHEGRGDRMHYLPAGLALVGLVERATQGYVDGVTGSSSAETMNRIFLDDVHLTRLGTYYMSLVTYASVFKSSPVGAWAPGELSSGAARSLQELAWSSVSSYYANPQNPSPSSCAALMRDSFCSSYFSYTANPGALGSCVSQFSQNNANNPFFFNPGSDASYWFAPAP